MRKLTAILAIVFLLLLGFAGWFYLGGTLRAAPYIQTAAAADYPEAYAAVRALVAGGAAPQTFADPALPEDPSGYTVADIAVRLTNRGLFPAEWLDARVEPVEGDVAVYAVTGEGGDVPARGEGQVNLKLITTAPADAQRTIVISYYVHGVKRQIAVR